MAATAAATPNPYDINHINIMSEEQRVRHITFYNPQAFYKLDYENMSEKVCVAAMDAAIPLAHVPEKLRTRLVCWAAVRRNGYNISSVPVEHMDDSLCITAFQTLEETICKWSLFIHSDIPITQRIVDFVFKYCSRGLYPVHGYPNNVYSFMSHYFMHNSKVTQRVRDISALLLDKDGRVIEFISEPTLEQCKRAIANTRYAIEHIPADMRTVELETEVLLKEGGEMIYYKNDTWDFADYLQTLCGAPDRCRDPFTIVAEMLGAKVKMSRYV